MIQTLVYHMFESALHLLCLLHRQAEYRQLCWLEALRCTVLVMMPAQREMQVWIILQTRLWAAAELQSGKRPGGAAVLFQPALHAMHPRHVSDPAVHEPNLIGFCNGTSQHRLLSLSPPMGSSWAAVRRDDTGRCWLSVLRDTRRPEEVRPELMELSLEMAREGAVSISMVASSAASLGFSASQSHALHGDAGITGCRSRQAKWRLRALAAEIVL